VTSSQSLSSIPEDLHGESEEDGLRYVSECGDDTESLRSSSKSSTSSKSSEGILSGVGVCNSSPPRSASDDPVISSSPSNFQVRPKTKAGSPPNLRPTLAPRLAPRPAQMARVGPPIVKLKWAKQQFELNLDDFNSVKDLSVHVQALTGVHTSRQTMIVNGKRLQLEDQVDRVDEEPTWRELRDNIRAGQTMMLIGRVTHLDELSEEARLLQAATALLAERPLTPAQKSGSLPIDLALAAGEALADEDNSPARSAPSERADDADTEEPKPKSPQAAVAGNGDASEDQEEEEEEDEDDADDEIMSESSVEPKDDEPGLSKLS